MRAHEESGKLNQLLNMMAYEKQGNNNINKREHVIYIQEIINHHHCTYMYWVSSYYISIYMYMS